VQWRIHGPRLERDREDRGGSKRDMGEDLPHTLFQNYVCHPVSPTP